MSHPIIELALRAVSSDLSLQPSGLQAIAAALDARAEDPDLVVAVRELMMFALYLGESLGAVESAQTLLALNCRATTPLEAQVGAAQERLRSHHQRNASRVGAQVVLPRAQHHDTPAPPGSTALGALLSTSRRILR